MSVSPELVQLLAWTMGLYVLVMFGISTLAQKKVTGVEDFVVAGRRLSMPLATATLLATWFGAGTLLTTSHCLLEAHRNRRRQARSQVVDQRFVGGGGQLPRKDRDDD